MRRESHKRSFIKSVGWRLLGVLFLALITYAFTRSPIQVAVITLAHHGVFLIVYYLHERLWLWLKWLRHSKFRPTARIFLYEIVLGNIILGSITLAVTGEWKQMTAITLTYILNKLWIYYLYDKLWDRVSWGRKGVVVYSFVAGDLFHVGHLKALQKAKALGDYLIVGVLTDEAILAYKRQPMIPFEERIELVANIKCVNEVVRQVQADPTENLKAIKPDILHHGDDWPEGFPGSQYMQGLGRKVVRTPYHRNVRSTTSTIQDIVKRAGVDATQSTVKRDESCRI